jgi:hypothetical protein
LEFAVLNASVRLSDTDVAFAVEGCNRQAQECADRWGVPRMPVAFYASVNDLPSPECIGVVIVDNLDDPGALGYHSAVAGLPFAKVQAEDFAGTAGILSHEILETLIDPPADRWWDRGNGTKVAAENSDPVEGDSYDEPVTLGIPGQEETRAVPVSNYVLPAWKTPGAPGPYDRMGRLSAPFTMTPGGYMVVEDANGNDDEVFARRLRHGGPDGERNSGRKLARADGRLMRRLRG